MRRVNIFLRVKKKKINTGGIDKNRMGKWRKVNKLRMRWNRREEKRAGSVE